MRMAQKQPYMVKFLPSNLFIPLFHGGINRIMSIQSGSKRFTWLLLFVVLLIVSFSLVACFGEAEAPASNTPKNSYAAPAGGAATAGPLKFIYLSAADCEPCKNMDPIITQLAIDYKDKVVVERYDAASDQGKKFMTDYDLKKNPSYVILAADGTKLWSNAGEIHKDMLHQQVETLLQK
jgi:thiol-disulfide isomerase/thioredoxin